MENPEVKAYFDGLVGMNIDDACKKLGHWWVCTNCHVTSDKGWYQFERAIAGHIELRTENNIVISEFHNKMAVVYTERDINSKDSRD